MENCYYYYSQFKSVQVQYIAAATSMCALQCQTVGRKSVCNQKVLWPFHCIEGLCHFPESSSKCSVGAHITCFTTCIVCGPTCWYRNLVQIQHELQFSPLLHTQNSPIPNILTPSLPNALPCLEPSFTRTSGPQNALSLSQPHFNSATQTYVYRQDSVTCYLLQHCGDQASEAVMWIKLEDQQGNTRDLAFSIISVLVKFWTVSSLTRHKSYWQSNNIDNQLDATVTVY
jgi:hypothetical protein